MALFFLQAATILLVTLFFGSLAVRLGQARVIGEIVGGIVLGPSVCGRLFPHTFTTLFPPDSLAPFQVLSTVGLVLFLFAIGTEVDLTALHGRRGTAVIVSGASILVPFSLAAALAHPLRVRFAPSGTGGVAFVLFLGIAMSITAFPVLARILEERKMLGTAMGTLAIFCAAMDDVVAWLLLALALTFQGKQADATSLPMRVAMLIAYLIVMLAIVRPLASWFNHKYRASAMSTEVWGCTLVGVLASAATTDAIGVHPLFGAFLAGICVPRDKERQNALKSGLNTTVTVFLLPLFFALIGMRTRIDQLSGWTVWMWALIVLLASVTGKFGGAAVAARWMGQSWKHALSLGALLNTRGLVELIVLNIAYDAGVFSPVLFTMFVMMALITTAVAVPILNRLQIEE